MIKYAKIINEETKEVSVALGSNPPRDYIETDVEQAYNGSWYVAGYAPEKPEEEIKKERAAELHRLLEEADYWTSKYCDGEYTAEEWAEKIAIRKAWREELRTLETEE